MRGSHAGLFRMKAYCPRWTVPREAVLDLLTNSQGHLSAKEIYTAIFSRSPRIGLTTVYRTLDLLERAGLVHRINMPDGQSRFELKSRDKEDHHHHLICAGCGIIINYRDFVREELELIKKIEGILSRRNNFVIQSHNIEFLGLCENCRPSDRLQPSGGKEKS